MISPHCLPVCKNRFEKFARIISRRHIQTTISDEDFLCIIKVKLATEEPNLFHHTVCDYTRICFIVLQL